MGNGQMDGNKPTRWRGTSGGKHGPGAASSSRGRKLFWLLAVLLALVGAIAALIFFQRPTGAAYFVTLPIREYSSESWPTNPLAVQDGVALLNHFAEDQRKNAFSSQTSTQILRELMNLPGDPFQPTLVHLCALGVAQNNKVYLIPGDSPPDNISRWIELGEILKALDNHPRRPILLLLDIARPPIDPKLGLLENDVAALVQKRLEELQQKNELPFYVLCSCSAGQVSLLAEEAGLSAFAFYLDRSLQGKADGYGSKGQENNQVTVQELAEYVSYHVDQWAKTHHHSRQTPILLGKPSAGNFVVLTVEDAEEAEAKADDRAALPPWLVKGWQLRDSWRSERLYLSAPRPYAELEMILLRAEQRWRGGIEPDRLEKELARDMNVLQEQMQFAQNMPAKLPHSLPTALMLPPPEVKKDDKAKPPPDPAALLKAVRTKFDAGELKLDTDKDREKAMIDIQGFWEAVKDVPAAKTLQAIVEPLSGGTKLLPGPVRMTHELLNARVPKLVYVETLMIHRLDEFRIKRVENKGWTWPENAASQALKATERAEQVVARLQEYPFALPWVQDLIDKADSQRRQGEKLLFEDHYTTWNQAAKLLAAAEEEYRQILEKINILKNAHRDAGQALAELPGYVPYLTGVPTAHADIERQWEAAVRQTIELRQLLESPDPSQRDAVDMAQVNLKGPLLRLAGLFEEERAALQRSQEKNGKTYLKRNALLHSPLLSTEQRVSLWTTNRQLGKTLHQAALNNPGGAPSVSMDEVRDREHEQADRLANLHMQLLKLGSINVASLEETWNQVRGKKSPGAWTDLARGLQSQWLKELPTQFAAAEKNEPLAERISYLLPSYDEVKDWKKEQPRWPHNPAAYLNRKHHEAYWTWLASRYQAEQQALPMGSAEGRFFEELAERLGQ
jgi:hypothetical protein